VIEPRSATSAIDHGPDREESRLSSPIDLTAVAEMNEVGHRLRFFENAATGRGTVIYRRYDGQLRLDRARARVERRREQVTRGKRSVRPPASAIASTSSGLGRWSSS